MFRMLARKPVATATLDMSGTNVTTAAWVQVVASLLYAASAVEIFNPSGTTMQIAIGAGGSEVAIKYTILPGGSAILFPFEFSRQSRISVKAVDATASSGLLVLNFFG